MSIVRKFAISEIIRTWKSIDYVCDFGSCLNCIGFCEECSTIDYCCSCTIDLEEMWISIMNKKRRDAWYLNILQSILDNGLVGALVVNYDGKNYYHLDGHHRLTAMYDLGFTKIPYIVEDNEKWSMHSSSWIGTGFREDIITRIPT